MYTRSSVQKLGEYVCNLGIEVYARIFGDCINLISGRLLRSANTVQEGNLGQRQRIEVDNNATGN